MSGSKTLSGRDKNNGMHTRSLSLANTHTERGRKRVRERLESKTGWRRKEGETRRFRKEAECLQTTDMAQSGF